MALNLERYEKMNLQKFERDGKVIEAARITHVFFTVEDADGNEHRIDGGKNLKGAPAIGAWYVVDENGATAIIDDDAQRASLKEVT